MSRRPVRPRRNPDPNLPFLHYFDAEFTEALEALGVSVQEEDGRLVAVLPNGANFSFTATKYLPSGLMPRTANPVVSVRAVSDKDDDDNAHLTASAWEQSIVGVVERAGEITGNVVVLELFDNSVRWASLRVHVPQRFPRRAAIASLFYNESTTPKAALLRVMAESRFPVPRAYRKQIGALVLQALKDKDLASYLQAKELAAMVAT
jgi:hypothetical protein